MPPPLRLQGKVAIVTGSSSGLGRAIALRYAAEGASVVCADLEPYPRPAATAAAPIRDAEDAMDTHDLLAERGAPSLFVATDVSDARAVEGLVDRAVEWGGRVDVMVNNAGVALEARKPGRVHETDEDTWDVTMRVNARSVFLGCKYATRQMLRQGVFGSRETRDDGGGGDGGGRGAGEEVESGGSRGWIINVSSIFGMVGGMNNPSYSASKGAVANLTRQVANDYGRDGIHCNAICPGHAETAIFAETVVNMIQEEKLLEQYPMGRFGSPDDIAKMAVVLASDDASWVTGVCLPVDGGFLAR